MEKTAAHNPDVWSALLASLAKKVCRDQDYNFEVWEDPRGGEPATTPTDESLSVITQSQKGFPRLRRKGLIQDLLQAHNPDVFVTVKTSRHEHEVGTGRKGHPIRDGVPPCIRDLVCRPDQDCSLCEMCNILEVSVCRRAALLWKEEYSPLGTVPVLSSGV